MTAINLDRRQRWEVREDSLVNTWHPIFSNFTKATLVIDENVGELDWYGWCATPEHLFQAMKAKTEDDRRRVLECQTPGQAKRMGRKVTLVEGWDRSLIEGFEPGCITAMRLVVDLRIRQHADFRLILAGWRHDIIEANSHNDTRWGTTLDGVGGNWLGQILMQARDRLQAPVR